MAVAASPLLCKAGPITVDSNSEQGAPPGLHSLGLKIGDDKDDSDDKSGSSHDHHRPWHFQDFGDGGPDRGWKDDDGGHHDNHGKDSDRGCHHRPPWCDPNQPNPGNHDGTKPVPESGSTAMLLGATLVGFLALGRARQAAPATVKIQKITHRR
jgi:hypothetical protein